MNNESKTNTVKTNSSEVNGKNPNNNFKLVSENKIPLK